MPKITSDANFNEILKNKLLASASMEFISERTYAYMNFMPITRWLQIGQVKQIENPDCYGHLIA